MLYSCFSFLRFAVIEYEPPPDAAQFVADIRADFMPEVTAWFAAAATAVIALWIIKAFVRST